MRQDRAPASCRLRKILRRRPWGPARDASLTHPAQDGYVRDPIMTAKLDKRCTSLISPTQLVRIVRGLDPPSAHRLNDRTGRCCLSVKCRSRVPIEFVDYQFCKIARSA